MNSRNDDEVFRAFAAYIYKDIQKYIHDHLDEYEEYLKSQTMHHDKNE